MQENSTKALYLVIQLDALTKDFDEENVEVIRQAKTVDEFLSILLEANQSFFAYINEKKAEGYTLYLVSGLPRSDFSSDLRESHNALSEPDTRKLPTPSFVILAALAKKLDVELFDPNRNVLKFFPNSPEDAEGLLKSQLPIGFNKPVESSMPKSETPSWAIGQIRGKTNLKYQIIGSGRAEIQQDAGKTPLNALKSEPAKMTPIKEQMQNLGGNILNAIGQAELTTATIFFYVNNESKAEREQLKAIETFFSIDGKFKYNSKQIEVLVLQPNKLVSFSSQAPLYATSSDPKYLRKSLEIDTQLLIEILRRAPQDTLFLNKLKQLNWLGFDPKSKIFSNLFGNYFDIYKRFYIRIKTAANEKMGVKKTEPDQLINDIAGRVKSMFFFIEDENLRKNVTYLIEFNKIVREIYLDGGDLLDAVMKLDFITKYIGKFKETDPYFEEMEAVEIKKAASSYLKKTPPADERKQSTSVASVPIQVTAAFDLSDETYQILLQIGKILESSDGLLKILNNEKEITNEKKIAIDLALDDDDKPDMEEDKVIDGNKKSYFLGGSKIIKNSFWGGEKTKLLLELKSNIALMREDATGERILKAVDSKKKAEARKLLSNIKEGFQALDDYKGKLYPELSQQDTFANKK